jgi:IPT/TIG domain
VVTSISPTSGPIAGGATVTVTGAGFTGATKVAFGTLAGKNLDVVNDHTILVTSPAEGPGTVAIRVTTPNGQSAAVTADLYTYVGPVLTSITPTSGPEAGGTSVTVIGTGFTGATQVTFGSVAGKFLVVVNDTTITVTSPAESPATVAVRVVTPNGSSATVPGGQFTFLGPVVTAISPTGGPTAGGTTVTVTGSGFTGATKVAFGTLAGKFLTVVNDHTITVTSPAEAAGTVAVRVTTPNGLSAPVTADLFTYS